jgi:hypothetical protein
MLGALAAGAGVLAVAAYAISGMAARPRASAEVTALSPVPRSDGRSVRLAVEPAGVEVELDGHRAKVTDGTVEITGAVGDTHRVRLKLGEQETSGDVAIAESGAVPSRLALPLQPVITAATVTATATASAPPRASARAAGAAKPPNNGMTRKFE